MRLKYALPLLSSAAAFMVVGLSLASAQPPERPTPPRVQVRPPGTAQPAEPTKQTPSGADQFQTGIEFEPIPPSTRVTFNLEDADLPDLVRLISSITGKRFILPGKTRSIKATVYAPTKVTVREAYNAFLSILEVNGMTVVPSGRYLKIQESANIENQPVSLYTGGSPTPSDDRYVTRLHRMTNISAEDASQLLGRFKSPSGSVTAYAPTNTLIITDTGRQIRRMLSILQSIDVPRTGEQVWIEPIHYADATEVAEKLREIFPDSSASSSGGSSGAAATPARRAATRAAARNSPAQASAATSAAPATVGSAAPARITSIIPEERTNSLIILATERAYLRILEMVRYLDVPLEGEGRIHVHYVQNGNAEDIASTLSSLIGGGSGSSSTPAGGAARRTPGAASPAAAAAAGDLFEGEIRVTTHEPTNALVITSSLHDYAALRRVIDKLDRPRRQVFIEAVVMELQVDRSSSLGLSFHGGFPDAATDGDLALFGFNAGSSIGFPANEESLTGMALGIRGPELEGITQSVGLSIPAFGIALNALASTGDANVLSTPHIIAMDNVQAEINVGQNVPLQTNGIAGGLSSLSGLAGLSGQTSSTSGLGALGGLTSLAGGLGGGVQRQDVGTIIRITPHINEHDEVRLEIEEEISEVGAAQGDLGVVPINRRTAKTEVMVRDQQTVVIGGLMRESVSRSETKIPILGDIPLLGALFRRQSTTRQKNNLLLFLTPYIIRDMRDLRAIYERKMRERQEFLDRYFVFGDHEYEPPVDYSRTRGLLLEMFNEMAELEAEAALAAALESQPPPEHVPRAPVGMIEREPGEREEGDVIIGPDGEEEVGGDVAELPQEAPPNDDVVVEEPE
ncbi:MAG: type II secretion system protein GspD [Sandaracinus sp.]|nr:type II secretion system protein GspD [Sandaracinus sp.]